MLGGRIVESAKGIALAVELHSRGYERIRQAYPDAEEANRQMVEKEEPATAGA
jgi:Fe-S cluster assembly ATP-binding protein